MELVRRADALPLDRLRDAIRAVREHPVHARGEGRRLPVHVRPRQRPRSPTLPAQPVTSVFYLFRDSPQRRAALELEPRRPRALRALRDGRARGARLGCPAQPRIGRAGPHRSGRRRGGETRRRGCGRLRRRLRDRPRVAPRGESRRRRPLDGRHRRDPADAPGARAGRADAVRVRRDRAAGAPRAAPARVASTGAYARALGSGSAVVAYSEHEAESLRRWLRERGADVPVAFVPFGVDVDAFRPGNACTRPRCRLRRSGPAPGLRAPARRRPRAARRALPRRDERGARSLARRAPAERLRRDGSALRRDARPARAGARRRTAGSRQQLLRRDDRSAPGDGAREARRRDADGRDRHGLRARGRENVRFAAPGDARTSSARSASCSATSGKHGSARVARTGDGGGGLTWERYVDRLAGVVTAVAVR